MVRAYLRGAAILAALAAVPACAPVRATHGFVVDSTVQENPVQAGVDTRATVLARYGSPSTVGMMDPSVWYYINSVTENYAFFTPRTVEQNVWAVHFGADDVVASVDKYGLERGRIVAFNSSETPTRGRELQILEQLFGNIGRNPNLLGDSERDKRPGDRH